MRITIFTNTANCRPSIVDGAGTVASVAYATQYTDAESGFRYLRARYYDPATDRFISVDPLASLTRQPHGYGAGDPLRWIDPSGLSCQAGPFNIPFVPGTATCSDDLGSAIVDNLPYGRLPDYVSGQAQVPVGAIVEQPWFGLQIGSVYDRYGRQYWDLWPVTWFPA